VVEPTHHGLSPRLGTGARIFLNLFQDLTSVILLVVDDVSVNSETIVVTSSIPRIHWFSLLVVLVGVGLHTCVRR
jgi:hypothetical protein